MRIPEKRKYQRGIALMLTMGMLSLILIMAMSFSYQATTDRMAAGNNADLTRARMLCESTLERLLAGLYYNFDEDIAAKPENVYPPRRTFPGTNPVEFDSYSASGYAQYYLISKDSTLQDNEGFTDAVMVNGIPGGIRALVNAEPDRSWQHIMGPEPFQDANNNGQYDSGETYTDVNGNSSWDADGALIARTAFVVLDESGKIDAGAVVTANREPFTDLDGDGARDSNEHYFDVDGDGAYTNSSVGETSTSFTGGSPQEIAVDDKFRSQLPRSGGASGERTEWFSLGHLLGSAFAGMDYFDFSAHSYDIEAFRSGPGRDVHRFDLSGYAWDEVPGNASSGWDDSSLNDADFTTWLQGGGGTINFWNSATPPQPTAVGHPTSATSSGGIPWLGTLTGTNPNLRKQVAANLVDFCDSDSAATTDYAADSATYVGLEKVPYVNEVAVSFLYSRFDFWIFSIHFVTMTVDLELVNMYDNAATVNVSADVDVAFQRQGVAATFLPTNYTFSIPSTTLTVPVRTYYAPSALSITQSWVGVGTGNSRVRFQVNDVKARVFDNASGQLADFARVTTPSGTAGWVVRNTPGLSLRLNTLEVPDPRCNTLDSDWEWARPNFIPGWIDTISFVNSNFSPSGPITTHDPEPTAANPWELSTAYIRNGPMQSLWELGAIHRGDPWQTINLRGYGTSGAYSAGDARILDQVKIGPQRVVRGKVNMNTPCEAVWGEILTDLNYDDTYDSPGSGSSTPHASLKQEIVAHAGSGQWTERGQLAQVSQLFTDGSTDREKEAVLGKLANLLTVRQNMFTVVAVAQAVKDLGTVDPGGGTVGDNYYEYASGRFCAKLAEQKILAVVYRDALRNEYRTERIEFLED